MPSALCQGLMRTLVSVHCSRGWYQPAELAAVRGNAAVGHLHDLCLPLVGVCGGRGQHPWRQHHACNQHPVRVGMCTVQQASGVRRLFCCVPCCLGRRTCSLLSETASSCTTLCYAAFIYPDNIYLHGGGTCSDVVTDTVHQFAPAYHDYVLYSDGTRKQVTPPKTVRTRTFVAGKALLKDLACLGASKQHAHGCWRGCSPICSQRGCTLCQSLSPKLPKFVECVRWRFSCAILSWSCSRSAVGQESSQQHQHGDNLLMNMELGGVSTWHKTDEGPPAPGQTDDAEGVSGSGAVPALDAQGSSEDQQLAGPHYTLRWVLECLC